MGTNSLISIIIPTHNRAHVLGRSIMSVIRQTYPFWELIVVDDGSCDGTEEILKNYEQSDRRITYVKRPKDRIKGANACRNIGIESAKGEFVAFLDSDDEWAPSRLEKVLEFINKNKAQAIYSGAMVVGKDHKSFRDTRPLRPGETAFDFLISPDSFAPTPSLVVCSKILRHVRFDEKLQRHQDLDFFIRVNKQVPWSYCKNEDVIVHWEDQGSKKVNFKSCVLFYQKYSSTSVNKKARIAYLTYISESCAKLNPSKEVLSFYKKEFLKEGVFLSLRQRFLLNSPIFFNRLYNFKQRYF